MSMKIDLSHPITSRANMIASFFEADQGVKTKFNFFAHVLKIYVQDMDQATALASIIRKQHKIGKLVLDVKVYACAGKTKKGAIKWVELKNVEPAKGSQNVCEAFDDALSNNSNYYGWVRAKDPCGITWYFALAEKTICQYKNDDIQNPWSKTTILAQDVMKRAFLHRGVQVSTVAEK